MRRVVVTGMGAVSPLGCGVEVAWSRLLAGRSGIRRLDDAVVVDIPVKIGGLVPDVSTDPDGGFDAARAAPPKDHKKMDRFILLALAAAAEAVATSRWDPQTEHDRNRTGVVVASGIGGFPNIVRAVRTTDQQGPKRLSPFVVPSFLANLAAGQVSIRHGFKGPLGAPVTACAAGVQAIGDAARLIRAGEADVVLCGGAESCVDRVALASFNAARALSTSFNDAPHRASRPFDRDRDGFVMSEGAGMLVLEDRDHALARNAHVFAEVVGYGTTADAYHITSGPEDGRGAHEAMRVALAQAGVPASGIHHINAHSTSTPVGDAGELAAIKALFGADRGVAISATKSATGHLLGAAGGLEAIFAILALRDQIAPPTLNFETPDADCAGLDIVGPEPRRMTMDYALSNGFGFGGVNASVLFRRPV